MRALECPYEGSSITVEASIYYAKLQLRTISSTGYCIYCVHFVFLYSVTEKIWSVVKNFSNFDLGSIRSQSLQSSSWAPRMDD